MGLSSDIRVVIVYIFISMCIRIYFSILKYLYRDLKNIWSCYFFIKRVEPWFLLIETSEFVTLATQHKWKTIQAVAKYFKENQRKKYQGPSGDIVSVRDNKILSQTPICIFHLLLPFVGHLFLFLASSRQPWHPRHPYSLRPENFIRSSS
jgi:hypothetical protein